MGETCERFSPAHEGPVMNVWLLTNSPSPYQLEFFSAIARSGHCQLHVRFMDQRHGGEDPLSDGTYPFSFKVLQPAWAIRPELRYQADAVRELSDHAYDIFILSGLYTNLTFLACARRLIQLKRPWLMWLERPWPTDYRPVWAKRMSLTHPWLQSFRNRLLLRLLTSSNQTFCIGSAAVKAYTALGAPSHKLTNLPYHCDTARFETRARRDAVRHCLHIETHTVFLFSGSLIPRKGCDLLVAAFVKLADDYPTATLLLLGSGTSQTDLDGMVPERLKSRVRFLGHRSQAELPDVFQAADVFVFPSRHDGWGVVLNEAAAASLPIIATESTGAAMDLVEPGRNGFRIPRDDAAALYDSMRYFMDNPVSITAMGRESSSIMTRFSASAGATTFCNTLESVLSQQTHS